MRKKEFKKLLKNFPLNAGVMARHSYFNSAVLVPLIKIKGEYFLLFQKRAKNIRQGGDICFPGGGYEKSDSSFEETALRETYEELGIKRKDIKVLGQLDTHVSSMKILVEPYVARIKRKALKKMKIDKNEVEKTLLIPLKFFKNNKPESYRLKCEVHPYSIDEKGEKEIHLPVEELGLSQNYKKPWGNKNYEVYVYKYKGEVIWGLTAVIINDLIKKY